ncbi:RDD family protein [Thermaerobacter composti]|uniref:RDD family protein n=1 Tax=Thermaerobacter composti TaxID=554949 RepID=A0ABZ0QNZ7_9FIRM|nr:RDD family protein [Thermaerobacter composti]WPD19146.1 RDD family protein [Thermaerobacter composti]
MAPRDRDEPAPVVLRWVAGAIDLALLSAFGNVTGLTVLAVADARWGGAAVGLGLAVMAATAAAYFAVGEGRWGMTLGKLAVGVRVVGADGRPPGTRRALVRFVARVAGTVALGAGWWPLLGGSEGRPRRAWHDAVAGTHAIRWVPWRQAPGPAARGGGR